MKISFTTPALPNSGALILLLPEGGKPSAALKQIDKKTGGRISKAMKANEFKGKSGETLVLLSPSGTSLNRVVLFGVGDVSKINHLTLQNLGGQLYASKNKDSLTEASVLIEALGTHEAACVAADIAYGALLRSYQFNKYHTKRGDANRANLKKLNLHLADHLGAKKLFATHAAVAEGVFLTRDLVTEPGNIIYPATLMQKCLELKALGVKVEVLDHDAMAKLNMGALLGVAQGSVHLPYLVVMHWEGDKQASNKKSAPIALVGKGVTFDSGGISIKPAGGMGDMKWDMAGAGAVIGTMHSLAARKAKAHVVGLVGLVENMPSGTAQRPGDVVTSASGQTIEVLNTDAEGRLVLADVLWYAKEHIKPKLIVDLATLTGAIIVALGHEQAGLFANNEELATQLQAAGKATGERLWPMPLGEEYNKQINSDIADMKNIGPERSAGSTMGAVFLERFVGKLPWAHLDIAGVAWHYRDTHLGAKGASAFGVRLLNEFIAQHEAQNT